MSESVTYKYLYSTCETYITNNMLIYSQEPSDTGPDKDQIIKKVTLDEFFSNLLRENFQKEDTSVRNIFEDFILILIGFQYFTKIQESYTIFDIYKIYNNELNNLKALDENSKSLIIPIRLSSDFLMDLTRNVNENMLNIENFGIENWIKEYDILKELYINNSDFLHSLRTMITFIQSLDIRIKKYDLKYGW